jgi:hypothetical protein
MSRRGDAPVVPADPAGELAAFLERLRGERLLFFPVRHHSPRCAWHLRRLIREVRPASVLVEGPESFDAFLPQLLHAATLPPVAIYTQLVTPRNRRGEDEERGAARRLGAYYPLCDHSPELVALRTGAAIGARVGFCDLDHDRQLRAAEAEEEGGDEAPRVASLLDDSHLQGSAYLAELARRRGCRDAHELWDRLFEAGAEEAAGAATVAGNGAAAESAAGEPPAAGIADGAAETASGAAFVRGVAAYCWFARAHASPERLRRDGTLAREAHMAARIERELAQLRRGGGRGALLVVTGGFHTPALALGWARGWGIEAPPPAPPEQVLTALVPYGFAQLDALAGYAAGMPSPGFYQRLWDALGEEVPEGASSHGAAAHHLAAALEAVALDLATELPARLRSTGSSLQLSTADAIAAVAQAMLLARTRGNLGPTREDLLDGMRGCFVKGELDVEGGLVIDLALELLRGDRVGRLPPDVRLHPLVADFRTRAAALGFDLESGTPRELALEIYAKARHRDSSRLLHRLAFLEVPYGRLVGGPDFVAGTDLDLQVERWAVVWSPLVEGALVEKGVWGSSLEAACVALLADRLDRLRREHGEVGALEAVRALMLALRLDLAAHLPELAPLAHQRLGDESSLAACAEAAAQLVAVVRLPGPFVAGAAPQVAQLASAAFQRACLLVRELPRCAPAGEAQALEALSRLRELVVEQQPDSDAAAPTPCASGDLDLDAELLLAAAAAALGTPGAPEGIRGGLAGLLFACGRLTAAELEAHVLAGLQGAGPQGSTAPAYLHGLFALCREVTWQLPAVMRSVHELLASWDDGQFERALPHLRLAFARHTPRETDRVAELLAAVLGGGAAIDWYSRDLDAAFVNANLAVAARVAASLERDGLAHFLESP